MTGWALVHPFNSLILTLHLVLDLRTRTPDWQRLFLWLKSGFFIPIPLTYLPSLFTISSLSQISLNILTLSFQFPLIRSKLLRLPTPDFDNVLRNEKHYQHPTPSNPPSLPQTPYPPGAPLSQLPTTAASPPALTNDHPSEDSQHTTSDSQREVLEPLFAASSPQADVEEVTSSSDNTPSKGPSKAASLATKVG